MRPRRSPSIKIDLQRWRMQVVMLLIFGAFIGLVGRLLYMQVFQKDFLVKQSDLRVKRLVEIPAHRGMLLDARGAHLAISIPAAAIVLNAREAVITPEQVTQLVTGLPVDRAYLERLLREKKARFVYLRRQAPAEVAEAVMALNIKGVSSQPEYRRYYTAGETMAQALGVTNVEDKGLEGIEVSYQSVLAGVPGLKSVIRDRSGNIVEELELIRLPKPGRDLTLSLNSQIQYLAYRELQTATNKFKAKGASAVVLDARTGEILALANYPAYNPNDRATMTQVLARNRAVTDAFEPGSTMKPIFISAALDLGIVKPGSRYNSDENLVLSGKAIRDTHDKKGIITVAQAIQTSSNVVMAKIAGTMRDSDIHDIYTRSGFGKVPGSGLPGETRGQMRSMKSKWLPIEKGALAYGHGVSVSLLQLARAYTLFANDGLLMPLTVEKRSTPVEGERVISEETAQQVRAMLESVTQEGGTAPKARVPGYRVAGKTGTAHKLINGSFAGNHYWASFVGMAPASNPRVVIAVVVDDPTGIYYAGEVAAPVFSRIMAGTLRFLALPPDERMESLPPVRTPVVAEAV